jgi:hypothetical protein
MIVRAGVALAMTLALAGCRSDLVEMKLGGPVYGSAAEAQAQERFGIDHLPEKTMGDRMLAAMALERVTGRKPDPARLLDNP